MLRFPLWILHPLQPENTYAGCNERGFRFAFTSAQMAADYLVGMNAPGQLSIRLVSRPDALDVSRELLESRLRGICLNPDRSGKGWNIDAEVLALALPPCPRPAPPMAGD
jgi:hypothetical protein